MFFDKEWGITEIPPAYITEKDGIKLIAIGKIHEVGEGCACTMGVLAKQFIEILRLNFDEVAITDTEVGIEHFGRAVEKSGDVILMVIDPSYESIKLSEKVLELSASIDKWVYFVLNKVEDSNEQFMQEVIGDRGRIIAAIPADSKLLRAGLESNEIMMNSSGVQQMCRFLIDNFQYAL